MNKEHDKNNTSPTPTTKDNNEIPNKHSTKKPYKIPSSLEGAFAVVIAQNAVILSHPVIDFANNGRITTAHFLIFSFALVNCFIVITNCPTIPLFKIVPKYPDPSFA